MAKIKQLAPLDRSYIEDEGKILRLSYTFPFSKSVVWQALLDVEAWTKWLPITKVTWTSPEPFAEGATRTVEGGDAIIDEVFFIWDEGERMAFCVDKTTMPVSAFAEDYKLTDAEGGCTLDWAFRVDANLLVRFLLKRGIKANIQKGFPVLEAYIRDNLAKFDQELEKE